ncbi:MAG: C_GCAxxG_C_C family protein [Spirochaetes bacterium]|nr:C_GCAxxG_C_C family protein [Spirochaetota bacterium]
MLKKYNLDEEKKKRIIDKAGHLADEIGAKYMACAPGTFDAIVEAFRSEGIEIFPPETQKLLASAFIGLHGGIAMSGVGTCGAITASTFLISYIVGVTTEELSRNGNLNYASSVPAAIYILARFEEVYGATDCLRLRYNRVQRAYDLLDPDGRLHEELFALFQPEKCAMNAAEFKDGRDQTPPVKGARWAAEAICDLLALEPEERKELPPHLQGLGMQEMAPKLQKVAEALKEMGFGRPNEKISYRDYWTFKLKGKKGVEDNRVGSLSAPED